TGRMLYSDELDALIEQLDEALFLVGPRFEQHWARLTQDYRDGPMRVIRDMDALGAPRGELTGFLDDILSERAGELRAQPDVIGLIAPHLDYRRGAPCYAAAYRGLDRRTSATRFVILGTNHFGRAPGVVGTNRDFETPWGAAPVDVRFMER